MKILKKNLNANKLSITVAGAFMSLALTSCSDVKTSGGGKKDNPLERNLACESHACQATANAENRDKGWQGKEAGARRREV